KHATWDANCTACHEPFSPMHERVALAGGSVTNEKCVSCHAGPVHHARQTPEQSCASCHRDHQGREHSLVRLRDSDCTSCHSDLSGHIQVGQLQFARTVTGFAEGSHPAFRSVRSDPGKLKFNHKLHLTPGIVRV